MPIGLELAGEPSVPEMIALARHAEALGIESIWLTETRFTRDAVTSAAAVATATHRVRIGTAVINPFTRGAILTGVTAATMDELAGGRFVLGIGPGSPTVLARQGLGFDRPLGRMRDTVEVVRGLLRGEQVRPPGENAPFSGAKLDFTPIRSTIPVYFGVTGPKALALAGEIAPKDVVLILPLGRLGRFVDVGRSRAVGGADIACKFRFCLGVELRRPEDRKLLAAGGRLNVLRPKVGRGCRLVLDGHKEAGPSAGVVGRHAYRDDAAGLA